MVIFHADDLVLTSTDLANLKSDVIKLSSGNFNLLLDKKSTLSPVDNGGQDERRIRRQEARNHYKLAVARKNNVVIILEEIKLNLQVSTEYLSLFPSTLT
jgi:hypothetical protein